MKINPTWASYRTIWPCLLLSTTTWNRIFQRFSLHKCRTRTRCPATDRLLIAEECEAIRGSIWALYLSFECVRRWRRVNRWPWQIRCIRWSGTLAIRKWCWRRKYRFNFAYTTVNWLERWRLIEHCLRRLQL